MEFAEETLIAAHSKREAMDFGLVLASQGLESTITQVAAQWGVMVAERDYERSVEILRIWKEENRGWKWRNSLPTVAGKVFHWGSLIWALATVAVYFWSMTPGIREAGMMDSQRVAAGQWWRLFTAVTLHADLPHLLSNITSGLILLGLAMARYGTGVALLIAFLSGVGGNVAGLLLYSDAHKGLGASGMVMGALGLLAITPPADGWDRQVGIGLILRGIAATFLMLVLIGFSPRSDVVAHIGGYVGGVVFGLVISRWSARVLQDSITSLAAAATLFLTVIITWWLALRQY
jgi:rhomboid protease GluP